MGIYWVDADRNQIAAKATTEGQSPANYLEIITSDREEDPNELYFDGEQVKLIPPAPDTGSNTGSNTGSDAGEEYYWSFEELDWLKQPVYQAPEVVLIDWRAFRNAMLANEDYDKTSDQMLVASAKNLMRLENALTTEPQDVSMIIALWNELIEKIVVKPSGSAIATWNQYATDSNIPLTFKSGGVVAKSS